MLFEWMAGWGVAFCWLLVVGALRAILAAHGALFILPSFTSGHPPTQGMRTRASSSCSSLWRHGAYI